MRVSLNVVDRVLLFSFINSYPKFQQTTASNFRMISAAKHVLSLSDKDKKYFGVREEGGLTYFDKEDMRTKDMEYNLPDPLMFEIRTELREMDAKGQLNANQFALWEKLMPAEEREKLKGQFNMEEFQRTEVPETPEEKKEEVKEVTKEPAPAAEALQQKK